MVLYRLFNPVIYYNLILFISFSISINYFVELKYMNLVFYIIFHLTFIYLVFYYYNYLLFFISFIYGIFFDIILINYITPHLLTFLLLLLIIILIRKNLMNLTPFKVSYIMLLFLFSAIFFEMMITSFLFNYFFNIKLFLTLIIIGLIFFMPIIYFFSKIDNF